MCPPSSTRAAYLGPPASFSHQAALNFFARPETLSSNSIGTPPPVELVPHPSFTSVFAAVQSSSADAPTYGVVPFENSSNGSVVQLLDLLADREGKYGDVKVCAEYYLRVRHCLLGRRRRRPLGSVGDKEKEVVEDALKRVEKLYTHPQAWGQCTAFLDRHFRGVERQDVSSTSRAAEMVAHEEALSLDGCGRSAAIASQLAAEVYGLDMLQEGIEDQGDNVTRFFVLRRKDIVGQERHSVEEKELNGIDTAKAKKWKSLISFTIDHGAPGALADALGIFRKHGFNLTSIDTRPSRVRPWHYIFFVECEQAQEVSDATDKAGVGGIILDLRQVAHSCRHLGRWRDQLDQVKTEEGLG
jgi:prephenate dehydratase